MNDGDLDDLEAIIAARGGFGHREHLELAWTYLGRHPRARARTAMVGAIQRMAQRHGATDLYHETVTLAWLHLVAVHRELADAPSFDAFIDRHPGLLDRGLLARHFSADLLRTPAARAAWAEPDVQALPALSQIATRA